MAKKNTATEKTQASTTQKAKTQGTKTERTLGYGCSCGFTTTDAQEFREHVFLRSKQDGKGTHRSIGQVDMKTGEVVSPPARNMTKEQRKAKYGRKGDDGEVKPTSDLSIAQQLRFVPRVFTCDYTPIMRAAQQAATREWGWREDMPLDNFLDTCLSIFFKDRGITLAGYIVEKGEGYAS